jgi:hypothetical protein
MLKKIVVSLSILGLLAALYHYYGDTLPARETDLDTPSPALGRAVATAFHQALTDPYFAPLERMTAYLDGHPRSTRVSVDMLAKWAPDDDLPTCFVWESDGSKLQLDHQTDQDVIDQVVSRLKEGLGVQNPKQLLYISSFRMAGEKYWLGFIRIPLGAAMPEQMAGVFFSMDRYIRSDVPRLLQEAINRARFPLVEFESNDPPLTGKSTGNIAIRILDKQGEVYFQHGRTFDPAKMIYSESRYFPKPIVAMQEGWDLQVFSANAGFEVESSRKPSRLIGFAVIGLVIVLIYWFADYQRARPISRPPFRG